MIAHALERLVERWEAVVEHVEQYGAWVDPDVCAICYNNCADCVVMQLTSMTCYEYAPLNEYADGNLLAAYEILERARDLKDMYETENIPVEVTCQCGDTERF